jgi:hypothetical protein
VLLAATAAALLAGCLPKPPIAQPAPSASATTQPSSPASATTQPGSPASVPPSGPTPSRTSPAPSMSTAPAPGGGACALPAYPTPACTGAPPNVTLTEVKGDFKATTSGQVIDGKRITGRLLVEAPNVTIRNSVIGGVVTNADGADGKPRYPFTIVDSTVGPETGCQFGVGIGEANFVALRVHVRGIDDSFRMSGDNVTIRDSFARPCSRSTSHSDGIQSYCPDKPCSGLVMDHNTIDQHGMKDVTSPIFLVDPNLSAVTLTNNLLAGGGYSLRLKVTAGPKWTVSGNKIVDGSWIFGPVETDTTCERIAWGAGNATVTVDGTNRITATVKTFTTC